MELEYKEKHPIRCPHCKISYYAENYVTSTAMYSPMVYRNGKMVSEDPNIHTHYCTCLNCGENFTFSIRAGKLYKEA